MTAYDTLGEEGLKHSIVQTGSTAIFLDPGFDISRGSNTFTLNLPVRLDADRRANVYDRLTNFQGGGNLAKWQVLASYTHRF